MKKEWPALLLALFALLLALVVLLLSPLPALAEPIQSPRTARAVAPSAGKNDSIAISDRVTSTGVPKTVVVLKNERIAPFVVSRRGTSTSCALSALFARRVARRFLHQRL